MSATSAVGTFRKWWSRCVMSAVGGRPEAVRGGANRRDCPKADVAVNRFTRLGVPDRFVKHHQIGALPSPVEQ